MIKKSQNKLQADSALNKIGAGKLDEQVMLGFIYVKPAFENLIRMIRMTRLTEKEWQVYEYLVWGLSDKDISRESELSVETIRGRIRTIYKKLEIHSRSEISAKDKIIRINKITG